MTEKHDVFVGNVTFNTSEDQLREIFSFVGPIKNIRILTDRDSGRPKGFAFIEYNDANTALAAIRHLDGHELNNRKLRVSYSNNSNLRELARTIGQVVTDGFQSHVSNRQEFHAVSSLQLYEAWDILDAVKRLIDDDKSKARTLLEGTPFSR
jgi:cleavage stimulation factor subunit 2